MSVEIKWNRTPQQIVDRVFDRETMLYIHTQLKAFCADYVPATEAEMLTDSAIPYPDYLEYPGPYAHYQWMGDVYGPNIPIYMVGEKHFKYKVYQ